MNWLKSLFAGSSSQEKTAPIIEDYHERGTDKEYRRPDDPEHIIRINQNQPKGCPRKIKNYVEVAGVSQPEYRTALESLIAGKERQITLEREPDNPHDPNAIKVIGHWTDKNGVHHISQIGWVPKVVASEIIQEVPERSIGACIEAMFKPVSQKSAGIRISIWGPRNLPTQIEPNEENEQQLLRMIAETETESKKKGWGVTPAPYEDLAKLYRRRKEYDKEVAVLERFAKQKHAPGVMPAKLLERLEKARQLGQSK
jgi:hypothetical protein